MKSWMMVLLVALCAGTVFAQGKTRGKGGDSKKEPGQMLKIKEISGVAGDSDYLVKEAPQLDAGWKLKINHSDSYTKDSAKGWHYFEVAYDVDKIGIDASGKKLPVMVIPEVEITYALLYDMAGSKLASSVKQNAKKAGGAIGWDKPSCVYTLMTETVTYTSITPRQHYAAVCVPPSSVAVYGKPLLFSVLIKVDGIQQGEIFTQVAAGATVDGKDIRPLVVGGKGEKLPWWESIQNKSESVNKVEGILRDRSLTPFIMYADKYYDQIKVR